MNRQCAPDLKKTWETGRNVTGENIFATNANIARGKVQPLPEQKSNFQAPRPKEYSSGQAKSKQFPITEIPNSKIRQANVPDFWYLGFGAWNFLYKILESKK